MARNFALIPRAAPAAPPRAAAVPQRRACGPDERADHEPDQAEPFVDSGSMQQNISADAPEFDAVPNFEPDQEALAASSVDSEAQSAAPAAPQHHEAQAANPSLAELEDELFPLPAEEQDHQSQPDSNVFVSGGFLPGSGNG